MRLYHDRHTILRSPKQPTLEEQLAGQPPMSPLQRVMAARGELAYIPYSTLRGPCQDVCYCLLLLRENVRILEV